MAVKKQQIVIVKLGDGNYNYQLAGDFSKDELISAIHIFLSTFTKGTTKENLLQTPEELLASLKPRGSNQ